MLKRVLWSLTGVLNSVRVLLRRKEASLHRCLMSSEVEVFVIMAGVVLGGVVYAGDIGRNGGQYWRRGYDIRSVSEGVRGSHPQRLMS